jgi:hypothetical protein
MCDAQLDGALSTQNFHQGLATIMEPKGIRPTGLKAARTAAVREFTLPQNADYAGIVRSGAACRAVQNGLLNLTLLIPRHGRDLSDAGGRMVRLRVEEG